MIQAKENKYIENLFMSELFRSLPIFLSMFLSLLDDFLLMSDLDFHTCVQF